MRLDQCIDDWEARNLLFLCNGSSYGILDDCSSNIPSFCASTSILPAPLMLPCPYGLLCLQSRAEWSSTLDLGLGYRCASSRRMLADIMQAEDWNMLAKVALVSRALAFHHEKKHASGSCWFKEDKGHTEQPWTSPIVEPSLAEPSIDQLSWSEYLCIQEMNTHYLWALSFEWFVMQCCSKSC